MLMANRKTTQSGFTVVELVISIVVIAILAALVIASYNGIQSRARDSQRLDSMLVFRKALANYYAANLTYPTDDQLTCADYAATLWQSGYTHQTDAYSFITTSLGFSGTDVTRAIGMLHTCNNQNGKRGLYECYITGPGLSYGYGWTGNMINYCAIKQDATATTGLFKNGWSPCLAGDEGACQHYVLVTSLENPVCNSSMQYFTVNGNGVCVYYV